MEIAASRSRILLTLLGGALAAILLAVLSSLDFSQTQDVEEIGQVILPQFEADVTRANRIIVTTSDSQYHLGRDGEEWFMEEKGRYPIKLSMLADLSEALSALTYSREMTRDPRKFDQLGLGAPQSGGAGALLQIEDIDGERIVDLIIGFKNGDVFVRHPEEDRAWAADAIAFPPLQRASRWLDLQVLDLPASQIERVEVEIGADAPYELVAKPDYPGEFTLGPPLADLELITDYAPDAPGNALANFTPLDVIPRDELDGSFTGRQRVYTHDGLMIEAELFVGEDGKFWVTFSEGIEAETPEAARKVEEMEARVAGWAFEVSRLDFSVLLTPARELVADASSLEDLLSASD